MDEQMIELIARAIAREDMLADGYSDNAANNYAASDAWKHFAPAARAAHSVIAGKVAELTEQAEFLCARVRELEGDLTDDDDVSRQYFGHVIPALARMESALAPYPERRSE